MSKHRHAYDDRDKRARQLERIQHKLDRQRPLDKAEQRLADKAGLRPQQQEGQEAA